MANLQLKHIYKIYDGNVTAVKDFNLDIEDKEFIVFVGPSGCGKSTTLRMIAGLEDISMGELYIDGKLVNELEPKDRDIAMVFQNYALYPHMTVFENMAFGLKIKKMPKDEIDKKVHEAAKTLDIEHLLKRKPKALSGGQRQRVAMGRALVRNAKVYLLDEPLSNLDAKLRATMRAEIAKLHQRLGTTFIYVTHDQIEAMTLGTKIVVMKDGVIQQVAAPTEIYKNPANQFVAGFIGSPQMNFFDGTIVTEAGHTYLKCLNNKINLSDEQVNKIKENQLINSVVTVGIRPENIFTSEEKLNKCTNAKYKAQIEVVENLGSEIFIHATCNSNSMIIKSRSNNALSIGNEIDFVFDIDHIHLFTKDENGTALF